MNLKSKLKEKKRSMQSLLKLSTNNYSTTEIEIEGRLIVFKEYELNIK